MNLQFFVILFYTFSFCAKQENQYQGIISAFKKIDSTPQEITFNNSIKINNSGGHLQGLQMTEINSEKYIFLSGSSDTHAYITIVKCNDVNNVISIKSLMDKPFKHAGGFQVYKNYLAIGIEDNDEKDKSKVCIYDISDPENMNVVPIYVIERKGEILRSTAGCVGIAEYKNELLIAVGDWDAKHIDFYLGKPQDSENAGFKLANSIETGKLSKKDWTDEHWYAYQNINLFNVEGDIFMVGLGQNGNSENFVDLYQLIGNVPYDFSMVKIESKRFDCTNGCTFKAGAGMYFNDGKMNVLACTYNITENSVLNLFTGE